MAIESANIPLPSEVILPFGGYMVSTGELNFYGVVIAGTVGGTVGSVLSYYLGLWGGPSFPDQIRPLFRSFNEAPGNGRPLVLPLWLSHSLFYPSDACDQDFYFTARRHFRYEFPQVSGIHFFRFTTLELFAGLYRAKTWPELGCH
jgi:hypothetical protein